MASAIESAPGSQLPEAGAEAGAVADGGVDLVLCALGAARAAPGRVQRVSGWFALQAVQRWRNLQLER